MMICSNKYSLSKGVQPVLVPNAKEVTICLLFPDIWCFVAIEEGLHTDKEIIASQKHRPSVLCVGTRGGKVHKHSD